LSVALVAIFKKKFEALESSLLSEGEKKLVRKFKLQSPSKPVIWNSRMKNVG
jgi:hypothetical protein